MKSIKNLIAAILFIELLDVTMLFVALPKIVLSFEERLLEGDWVIIGFLLAVSLFIMVGRFLGDLFGIKRVFLWSQFLYIVSSIACGLAKNIDQLVIFRIIQGVFAGIIIPIGISYWLSTISEKNSLAKGSKLYLYEMIFALGLAPIYAGFITQYIGWRWLFFIKVPFSILFLILSGYLLQPIINHKSKSFNWRAFALAGFGLYVFLLGITLLGDLTVHWWVSVLLIAFSALSFIWFYHHEKNDGHSVIRFSLFKIPEFSLAIFLQSCVMLVFLAATFILSLFLIGALKFTILQTGWIISSLGLGMFFAMIFIKLFYSSFGAKPLIALGVILVAFSMFAFTRVSRDSNVYWISTLVFLEGFGAWLVRVINADVIFSSVPHSQMEDASRIYTLTNQIMATIGVAMTTMIIRINLVLKEIPSLSWATPHIAAQAYYTTFIVLGVFPVVGFAVALIFYFKMNYTKIK